MKDLLPRSWSAVRKGYTGRVVLALVSVVLGGLLFLKITGRQDIFSYQGIKTHTPWFGEYEVWVRSINIFLEWKQSDTGSMLGALTQGLDFLRNAYTKTTDKKLWGMASWQLDIGKGILFIEQTRHCFGVLSSWFQTIDLLSKEYAVLISGYNLIQEDIGNVVENLPDSATRSCLQNYLQWLQNSLDSLALTYRNIDTIGSDYYELLGAYRSVWGQCEWIENLVAVVTKLYNQTLSVNQILMQVQKALRSHDIAQYNEMCKFGGVHWLTWLQQTSWQAVQSVKTTVPALQPVTHITEYIQSLKDKVVTLSGDDASKMRWDKLLWR